MRRQCNKIPECFKQTIYTYTYIHADPIKILADAKAEPGGRGFSLPDSRVSPADALTAAEQAAMVGTQDAKPTAEIKAASEGHLATTPQKRSWLPHSGSIPEKANDSTKEQAQGPQSPGSPA